MQKNGYCLHGEVIHETEAVELLNETSW